MAEATIAVARSSTWMGWTTDPNVLWIQRLNRLQNRLDLIFFDLASGGSKYPIDLLKDAGVVRDALQVVKAQFR